MKHLLPDVMSLLRTDLSRLKDRSHLPVISSSTALPEAIPYFSESPHLLIQDEGSPIGYIEVTDVLQHMLQAHRLMEAYFETTIETAGTALTLINEEAKVAYWTTDAERVFRLTKRTSSDSQQQTFSRLTAFNRSRRCTRATRSTVNSTSPVRICSRSLMHVQWFLMDVSWVR